MEANEDRLIQLARSQRDAIQLRIDRYESGEVPPDCLARSRTDIDNGRALAVVSLRATLAQHLARIENTQREWLQMFANGILIPHHRLRILVHDSLLTDDGYGQHYELTERGKELLGAPPKRLAKLFAIKLPLR